MQVESNLEKSTSNKLEAVTGLGAQLSAVFPPQSDWPAGHSRFICSTLRKFQSIANRTTEFRFDIFVASHFAVSHLPS